MRRRLTAYRVMPAGGGLALVLGASVIVLLIGPHHDQRPALVVLAVVLAMFAVGAGASARGGARIGLQRTPEEGHEPLHAGRHRLGELPDPGTQSRAWEQQGGEADRGADS